MARAARGRSGEGGHSQRGASALEFALVLPVIVFMIFGIIETGFIVRDLVSIRSAAEDGVRSASVAANTPTADFKILNAVKGHLGIPKSNIVRIVVYKASGPGVAPSASCKAGAPLSGEQCNVYTAADFNRTSVAFGCKSGGPDLRYCPTNRGVTISNPDWLGVYVKAQHTGLSGIFNANLTIERTVVLPLERGASQ